MQLKYNITIKNKNITLELEVANLKEEEISALEKLGEPDIKFEKIYENNYSVSFDRKLNANFKLKLRFDGSENIESAIKSTNSFLEDLKIIIENKMKPLMDMQYMIQDELNNVHGYIDINY